MERVNILYRGPLSSCNYSCHYCPFAKRRETASELVHDRDCLKRFVRWLEVRTHRQHGVLFTPWGEALVRSWYRAAIVQLSHMEHVARVAIQTNLSATLNWLNEANLERVAFWCTFHPQEVTRARFLRQCQRLETAGARYSVGCVGLPQHADEIRSLRDELPAHVYLWINAYKSKDRPTDERLSELFTQIDALYPVNAKYHQSRGQECDTGRTTVSVDGQGNIRRCHFVQEILGNMYEQELDALLFRRPCPNATCGCHIGYVHMPALKLKPLFRQNILERILSSS